MTSAWPYESLVQWIDTSIREFPNRMAAVGNGSSISYSELDQRSHALSSDLIAEGVKVEDRVGLWSEQGASLLVGVLGILRAGAAYVPLDPSYPIETLEYVANDANLAALVAPETELVEAGRLGRTVVSLDRPREDRTRVDLPHVTGNNLAYVIYTSGSTGRPKGVAIEHHSIVDLLQWMVAEHELSYEDCVMGTASLNFDGSVPNYLMPLVVGGTFVALPASTARDPYALADAVVAHRPKLLQTSPTMLKMLTEIRWDGDTDLVIITGGERTAGLAITYIVERVKSLYNYYGPTEATVNVICKVLTEGDVDSPIGFPLGSVRYAIVTDSDELVNAGEAGELVIIGDSLARGYLGNPQLTSERFQMLKLGRGVPERAYRTGDMARVRPDGCLEVLGRIDDQIKLRDYRIEPGEVEHALMQHPIVVDAVVVASSAPHEVESKLVAYIVANRSVDEQEIRRLANQLLPHFMRPAAYYFLDSFPLTPNGKTDRLSLRNLATREATAFHGGDEDSEDEVFDAVETKVRELFAEALDLPSAQLGRDRDFFELGGTSLRCVHLFVSIEDEFGISLPLSTMVAAPSIRLLALEIRSLRQEPEQTVTVATADSSPIAESTRTLWKDVLGVASVQLTDDFFQLGGTDDQAREMLQRLGPPASTQVTLARFHDFSTLEQLVELIDTSAVRDCVVTLSTEGEAEPFFCVAGAGELAIAFLPLARRMDGCQPVYGLQAKGLERRALPDYTISRTAKRFTREILHVQPHGPFRLGGHSLGGVIAFKIAQRLRAQGHEVEFLALFDTRLRARMFGKVVTTPLTSPEPLRQWRPYYIRPDLLTLLQLPFAGIVRQRGVKQYQLFSWIGTIQSRFERYLGTWSGPTTLYVSSEDGDTSLSQKWSYLLSGEWSSIVSPGDHNEMMKEPHVSFIADHLSQQLRSAGHGRVANNGA